jgi:hypothetical protein
MARFGIRQDHDSDHEQHQDHNTVHLTVAFILRALRCVLFLSRCLRACSSTIM